MSAVELVCSALDRWPKARECGQFVVVPTHVLYPSNAIVNVYVGGRTSEFLVHDDGNAFDQLHAAGGHEVAPLTIMRNAVRRKGLSVSDERSVYAAGISAEALEATIVLVANASREAAEHLIARMKPAARRPLTEEVETLLNLRFPSRWRREEAYVGYSNKQHRFDYAVSLPDDRVLLMDIVKPEASSINAAVVAHLDVSKADSGRLVHRVIYDDQERWSSENLSLLGVGAIPVPFSSANMALKRLAA